MFDYIAPKAIMRLQRPDGRQRMYNVMSLRLGHSTGKVVKWKDIASQTYDLRFPNHNVSKTYCMHIFKRGIRCARWVIEKSQIEDGVIP